MKPIRHFMIGIFLTGIFSSATFAKSDGPLMVLDQEWVLEKDTWGLPGGTWYLRTNRDIYVTEVSQDIQPTQKLLKPATNNVLNQITDGRLTALALLGIKDWRITENKITTTEKQTQLTLSGSFHDSHSHPTNFKEVHIWSQNKYRILSINFPSETKFGESEQTKKVITRFISSVQGSGK